MVLQNNIKQQRALGTQCMAWIPSMSLQMFKVASMGPVFTQTLINGSKCCVMWAHGPIHFCCLSTVSTCLTIDEHRVGLFQEWIPDHCASTLRKSHYLEHTHPTLQVMRVSRQCSLPWKLCVSEHKVICIFMLHFQSGITPWSLSVDLKHILYLLILIGFHLYYILKLYIHIKRHYI